jgi:signal transduction histidine kinase/ActR/RegA family two-component response regulator
MRRSSAVWFSLAWVGVFALGALAGAHVYARAKQARLAALLVDAQRSALAFSDEKIAQLSATDDDLGTSPYAEIKARLVRLREIDPRIRFAYLMRRIPGTTRTVFIADSEPEESEDISLPGDEYDEAKQSPGLQAILHDGQPSTEGPLADSFGTWVTGYSVVRYDANGLVEDVIGLDIDAGAWRSELLFQGGLAAGCVWSSLGLPLAVWCARRKQERQLRAAKEQAEAGSAAKSQFLAMMSHEIRTPLNGVIGMTSILSRTELAPEQRECVNVIQHSSEVLLGIINDILNLTKIEAGKLDVEEHPFSVRALVNDTIAFVRAGATQKNIALRYDIADDVPQLVVGDCSRTRQVLVNLVANALKFTERGEVALRVETQPPPKRLQPTNLIMLSFTVRDSGIGIPPEKQARLFAPFSQVDTSTSRRFGGTGLGLAISKRLCELMGGGITLESDGRTGSTFRFWITVRTEIPVTSAPPQATMSQPVPPPPTPSSSRLAILLVEDNPVNALVVRRMLTKLNHSADEARNGLEALEACRRRAYDVVLMDLQMPEMDGMTATAAIRGLPLPVQPWIVALTADAMQGDRERCLAGGMDAYETKPLTIQRLAEQLARFEQSRGNGKARAVA